MRQRRYFWYTTWSQLLNFPFSEKARATAALNRPGLESPVRKRERNEIPTVPGGVWESLVGTDHNPPPRFWPPTPKLCRRSSVVAAARPAPGSAAAQRRSRPAPRARLPPAAAAPERPSRLPPPLRGSGIVLPPSPPPPPPARSPRLWHPQRTFSPQFARSSPRRSSFAGEK